MQKVYNRIYWENEPSHSTPLSESNLNKLDYALDVVDTRVAELSGYEERAEESADSADASAAEARELKRQVQALVAAVNAITANATTLNPGSSATASFDSSTGVLSLGIPRGDSGGITAPVNGMYTMYVDSDGNLWLVTNGEQGSEYWWQYNPTTGELYYRTPGEYVEKTIVGDVIVEITDGVEGFPIKSLVAEITPVQSGSGDPSPTNIRPISGRTGMTVYRTGKNLFDESTIFRVNSTVFRSAFFKLKAGTYYFRFDNTNNCYWFVRSTPDGTYANFVTQKSGSTSGDTFTLTSDEIMYLEFYKFGGLTDTPTNIQIEVGSTATDYEPYSGQTYDITFPSEAGTVYGGTLDVVSGVLTVDRAIITLDGSQAIEMSQSNRGYVQVANAVLVDVSNQLTEASVICDRLKPTSWGNLGYSAYNLYCAPLYGRGVAFRDDTKTTAADWTAYFTENPTQFSYKLATPQTYQLTPTEVAYIETLNGINILYTDAGSINEVTYIVESYEED